MTLLLYVLGTHLHTLVQSPYGSFVSVFAASIQTIVDALDLSEINQDGNYTTAKMVG